MHGYDPELINMHGIFYARGTDIKVGMNIPPFENIHIYPLICRLLDISPYKGYEDSQRGDIHVLEKILKEEQN